MLESLPCLPLGWMGCPLAGRKQQEAACMVLPGVLLQQQQLVQGRRTLGCPLGPLVPSLLTSI
jgi:hypothetical protein